MHGTPRSIGTVAGAVGLLAVFGTAGALTVWLGRPAPERVLPIGKNTAAQRAEERLPLLPRLEAEALAALIQRALETDLDQLRPDVTAALTRLAQLDPPTPSSWPRPPAMKICGPPPSTP